jgi:hypothetical protein
LPVLLEGEGFGGRIWLSTLVHKYANVFSLCREPI